MEFAVSVVVALGVSACMQPQLLSVVVRLMHCVKETETVSRFRKLVTFPAIPACPCST